MNLIKILLEKYREKYFKKFLSVMTKVTIATLHFGDISTTKACLDSLFKMDRSSIDLDILVINNDLRVIFPEIKNENGIKVTVINNKKNTGFAGGHNQGFRFALKKNSDFHMIINNDVIVNKNLLKELINCFKNNKNVGIASPKIYFTKGHEYHKDRYSNDELGKVIWYAGGITDWDNLINKHRGVDEVDKGQFDKDCETEFATGACALLPREVIQNVKGFDERYFLYYEDGDINMRIKRKGYKVFYCAKAKMWHNNAGSSGSGSTLQDYYITRNRLLFGFTYASFRTKVALFRESLKILSSGRKWQKIGVKDFYFRKFGRGSYPI